MKKFSLFLFLIIGLTAFAQQKGISYQAVIINPSEIQAPGFNGTGSPLANKSICMSFQIVNTTGQIEYQEIHSVTTDSYGMVNLVIGTGTSGTGLVSTLEAVSWNQGTKKLVVGYNSTGVCSNYTEVSNQLLNYSPYSLYAQNADIKDGYVTDVKVAMGINPAKVGLGNVNNTSDASKPVSIATQTALNLKANTTDVTTSLALKEDQSNKSLDIVTDATSTVKYPSVKAVKDYVDSNASSLTIGDADAINKGKIQLAGDLSGTAAVPTVPGLVLKANTADVTTALSTKVDKESGKGLSTNDYTSLEKTKLAAIIGTNTGDQDLSTFAVATDVTASLALKEDQSNKSLDIITDATSTIKYPSVKAVKDYVDANAGSLTIGAISTTSTSTGANITAGILSLTSADASNGGIVTTGVQTFGGAKTFSADLVVNSITIGKGNSEVWSDPNETEPIPNTTNTAIGFQVLKDNFDGIRNTGVGYKALSVNDEGSSNTAIGYEALRDNDEASKNTAVGSRALQQTKYGSSNGGYENTAIGSDALNANITGKQNTALGANSGTSGTNQAILINTTAVGYNAKVTENNTIQLGNTDITNVKTSGTLTAGTVTYPNAHNSIAGQVLTTDASGVASWATSASGGTALTMGSISGTSTANGASITDGVLNLAPADGSNGGIVTTGTQSFRGAKTFSRDLVVNGITVGQGKTNDDYDDGENTAIGQEVLKSNEVDLDDDEGILNTGIGYQALYSNTIGYSNTAVGHSALYRNSRGYSNTAVGRSALYENTRGEANTAIGEYALESNTTGDGNIAIGFEALKSNSQRDENIAIGNQSLLNTIEGNYNIAIGSEALKAHIGEDANIAIGRYALKENTRGSNNVALGYGALEKNDTGINNVALGTFAGVNGSFPITNSTFSVFIGHQSRPAATDDQYNQIVIGYGATGNGTNTIQLGNADITNVKTSGTLTAGTVTYPNTDGLNGQVLTTNGTGTLTWTTPPPTYEIGDQLAGGIVFYVYDNGKHGLIANTFDQTTFPIAWSLDGTETISTGARADGIGAGFKNTTIIIGKYGGSADPLDAYAATVCNEFVNPYEGYISDWYLPSIYELNLLFYQSTLVGLTSGATYWSSSEFGGTRADNKSKTSALSLSVPDDPQESLKSSLFRVRAIRSF